MRFRNSRKSFKVLQNGCGCVGCVPSSQPETKALFVFRSTEKTSCAFCGLWHTVNNETNYSFYTGAPPLQPGVTLAEQGVVDCSVIALQPRLHPQNSVMKESGREEK